MPHKEISRLILAMGAVAAVLPAQSPAPSQAARVVVLDVLVENVVSYRRDGTDPSALATARGPVAPALVRTFQDTLGIGDIVSVNGKPAKGVWTNRGHTTSFSPTPAPGAAIADVALGNHIECTWELYGPDGTYVGRLSDRGSGVHAITGGGGAFLGAIGEHFNGGRGPGGFNPPLRSASMTEDPSMRRVNGGGTWQALIYLIPAFWPEVESTPQGPAVFHADLSLVSEARPASPGEVLIIRAKGLGPTRPSPTLTDPRPRPAGFAVFRSDPLEEVNSPVEVTVNGNQAEVLNKIGWPGERDTYRVDLRVPPDTPPGPAIIKLTAGWIPGSEVLIPVR